jgi:hypothetical protein
MKYSIINSFNNIEITDNSLVLCDIDETLLTNKFIKLKPKKNNKPVIKMNLPKYTDKIGFLNLMQKLNRTNSKLCFVTSRDIKYFEFTRKQFKFLGINIEKFPVFFCGDTPKGLVIKTKINLSKFKDILFIDDLKYNLDNVKKELGEKVQCILFEKSNIV